MKDKKFEIVFNPTSVPNSILSFFNDWCDLVYKKENEEEVWYTIPALPQYSFKNLKYVMGCDLATEDDDVSITYTYDEFKNIIISE